MKITLDKNHLLVIENPNIPQTKEYTHIVDGYVFSDFDKWLIVLHKKQWKIINLKNLWEWMCVAYIRTAERRRQMAELDIDAVKYAFGLFDAFDENSWEKYYFIPGIGEKDIEAKNKILNTLELGCFLEQSEGYISVKWVTHNDESILEKRISFLFGLLLIYGKFEWKNNELNSVKIQLPLFGQYLKYADLLHEILKKLQEHGFFLTSNKLETSNGIVYQISCRDYEILEIFALWYQRVEKFARISKAEFTQEMKSSLLEFISSNKQIPDEWKSDVLEQIKNWVLKLLTK